MLSGREGDRISIKERWKGISERGGRLSVKEWVGYYREGG